MEFQLKNQWSLTPVFRSDKADLIQNVNDPEIANQTLTIPYPYSEEDAGWWFDHMEAEQQKQGRQVQWAIRSPARALAGSIGIILSDQPHFSHRLEIGYWLGKKYRNKGVTSDAIRILSDHFLYNEHFARVQAFTFSNNIASGKALEKAGFMKEGVLRKSHLKNGLFMDTVVWGRVDHS